MPEIFRIFGLRFFFYSNDHKPVHIHVHNADGEAKFNIGDTNIELINSSGMEKEGFKISRITDQR